MKAVKSNMKDQILTKDRKILHCSTCGLECSGNLGDYFHLPAGYVFTCECGAEMELVEKHIKVTYK